LKDLGIDGKIILKLKKWEENIWIDLAQNREQWRGVVKTV
jgi:hypothetical protein